MKAFSLKLIVPVFMVIVVGIQIFSCHFSTLSCWRGGGFGMYTVNHWSQRSLWFFLSPLPQPPHQGIPSAKLYRIRLTEDALQKAGVEDYESIYHYNKCKIHPTAKNCSDLVNLLQKQSFYTQPDGTLELDSFDHPRPFKEIKYILLEVLDIETEKNSNGLYKSQKKIAEIQYDFTQ